MSKRLLTTLLVLGCPVIALGPVAPAEAASRKAIWGTVRMPDGGSAFPYYHDLGVRVFQIQLRWEHTAPRRPLHPTNPNDAAYRWPAGLNFAIREARRYGIKVAIMVHGSPAWANGGRSWMWAPKPRDYSQFVLAASRRYAGVRMWMIWGEPSLKESFQPLPPQGRRGPRIYARMLDASYGVLKRRNRRNIVIGGGTVSFADVAPPRFVKYMRLPSGRPPRLDWFLHNPYSRRFPRLSRRPYRRPYHNARDFSDIDTFANEVHRNYLRFARKYQRRGPRSLRRYFRRFLHRGPPLWLSEFSVSSDHVNRSFGFFVSRTEQARWLSTAYRIVRRQRYVAGLGWFNFQDAPASQSGGLTTGLITYKGVKKPAYFAYRRAR